MSVLAVTVWAGPTFAAASAAPVGRAPAAVTVQRLGAVPARAVAGGTLAVEAEVANAGTRREVPHLSMFLSRDDQLGLDDVALTPPRRLDPLQPGQSTRHVITSTVPPRTAAGAYRVIACADTDNGVRGRRDGDGCAVSAGSTTVVASGPSPEPTPTPDPAADPLDVTLQVDRGRAVTKRIGEWGGTISTTAADGTVLTLTVPTNALLTGEDITITPVTGIEGLPFSGGLTGAVHLEPEGLRLLQPAVLEIRPAAGAPSPDALTMFAWTGTGADFHLYPPRRETDPAARQKLTMDLWHFSGYGAGAGTAAERDALGRRRPDGGEAAGEQDLADLLRDERECQLAGTSCVDPEELKQQLIGTARATYTDSVKPALDAALTDDTLVESAIGTALAWLRPLVLLGIEQELAGEAAAVEAAIGNVLVAAYDRAAARCSTDPAAVGRMLTLMRTGTLLGIADRFDQSKVRRCLQFELELETKLHAQDWRIPEVNRTVHVRAKGLRYDGLADTGDAPEVAWVPLEFVFGEDTDATTLSTARLTGNLGCEVALDDVAVKYGNLRAGSDPITELSAVLRMRGPNRCEQWTDVTYGNVHSDMFLRIAWGYEFNNLRPHETWVPGYTYWHGHGGEYLNTERFDARYYVYGLRGSGGTWTLTFDRTFRPTTNLQSTVMEWEPFFDYTEQTTVTVRHAAAG